MDRNLKVPVRLWSLQKMVLVRKDSAVLVIDGSEVACCSIRGMPTACEPFHFFSLCRLVSAGQSPTSSIASLPQSVPCARITVTVVFHQGHMGWRRGSIKAQGFLLLCFSAPNQPMGLTSIPQNLKKLLRFCLYTILAVQCTKDNPHTQMHSFKYHDVME